jgi:tRNA threonylcarbamoyladenosine modification (KEOPS) complex Cgi121 subunit
MINTEKKIRMSIKDITREGDRLAVTVGINDAEITLFGFDEVREFSLGDLLIMLRREE